jgi:HEAT repeat protein
MAGIAIKTGVHLQPDKLIELFNHESAAVRTGALHLINDFYEKLQRNFKPFKTDRMLICYRDFSKASDVEVAVQAIRLLGKTGHKKDVDFLLERISIDFQNHPIDEEAINAINLIIQRISYPFQIEPRYMAALANNRYTLRVAALQGLRYSPRTNFKKALADKYKNDIHPVSEAARNLLSAPFRSIGIRLQEIAQKWGAL